MGALLYKEIMTDIKDTQDDLWLSGKLLVAMPGMEDPRFARSVVFVCAHDENGAMGLMINKEIPDLTLKTLLEDLMIDEQDMSDEDDFKVLLGGPMETTRGFLLHGAEFETKDTIKVREDYAVTGTVQALKKALKGDGPKNKVFALGYAAWDAGQLEQEIQDNAWLVCDALDSIIFGTDQDEKWGQAMRSLGIDPAIFAAQAGHA
jgi:putative transcriptional regulator